MCTHHSKQAWPILWDTQLWVNIIQIPLEVLTAQLLSELPPVGHVSKGLLETKTTINSSTFLIHVSAVIPRDPKPCIQKET